MIVAFVNQKGGVGKTTLAIHFTAWLKEKRGFTKDDLVILDADRQGSARAWAADLDLFSFSLTDHEKVGSQVESYLGEFKYIIIDGAAGLSSLNQEIIKVSDLLVIPCRPTGLDIHSTSQLIKTVNSLKYSNKQPPIFIVLNQAIKNTLLLKESLELLKSLKIPYSDPPVYLRQAFADASGQGKTIWSNPSYKKEAAALESLFFQLVNMLGD